VAETDDIADVLDRAIVAVLFHGALSRMTIDRVDVTTISLPRRREQAARDVVGMTMGMTT
jgi:hypothetical protein